MKLRVLHWLGYCPAKKLQSSQSNIKLFFKSQIVKFLKNQAVSSVKAASSQIPIKIKKINDH